MMSEYMGKKAQKTLMKSASKLLIFVLVSSWIFSGWPHIPFTQFPPQVKVAHASSWYNTNYAYCREMTMTAGGGSGGVATTTTAGFALVATSTISTLAATSSGGRIEITSTASGTTTPVDVAITNGTDCDEDGGDTVLDFYFEQYDQTTGQFVLWVEPDDISSTTAKSVLMYYGNPDGADLSDESGVFGALDEEVVWNFHENPADAGAGGILDSTANSHDATDTNMEADDLIQGRVDGALDFNGTDEYLDVVDNNIATGQQSFTLSTWFFFDDTKDDDLFFINNNGDFNLWWNGNDRFGLGDDVFVFGLVSASGFDEIKRTWAGAETGVWHYVTGVHDAAADTLKVYIDGVQLGATGTGYTNSIKNAGTIFDIGIRTVSADGYMNGYLDDMRIHFRALTEADILTIYNNTSDSATFWTFGEEEANCENECADTVSTAGAQTWTAPAGVTSADVACWGGGGGGGRLANSAGGGGGGGAYAASTVSVTPGSTYDIYIGNGGDRGSSFPSEDGGDGENTTFATTTVVAVGGAGGDGASGSTGGAGGLGSSSTGDATSSGGTGGDGETVNDNGGGGGGGAGPDGDGVDGEDGRTTGVNHGGDGGAGDAGSGGAGGPGGTASSDPGDPGLDDSNGGGGGGGASNQASGAAGGAPAGGGGGGETGGGDGADGQCTVTYTSTAGGDGTRGIRLFEGHTIKLFPGAKMILYQSS